MKIAMLDKSNFPIFQNYRTKHGKDLIYLDNSATTQKLDSVLQKMNEYYLNYCSNVHRGIYTISELATEEFELVRTEIAKFFKVNKAQIIFTSGTTDSLNIIARSCKNFEIDQIVTTELEHNSNILPFEKVSNSGLKLQIAKLNDDLSLNYQEIERLIDNKRTLLTITGCSNVTGEIIAFTEINKLLNLPSFGHLPKRKDVISSLDAAQLIPHILLDPEFDIENLKLFDFISFSGHKMFGPTGIGVLIVNNLDLIDKLETNVGGGMVENIEIMDTKNLQSSASQNPASYKEASLDTTLAIIYKNSPERFEAGTQNIAGVIGLGEVFREINNLKIDERIKIKNSNQDLAKYTFEKLSEISELKLISNWNLQTHAPIFTFTMKNIHPHDVAQYLSDEANICVRAGQHCTHLLHKSGNINASVRISLSIYNTKEEIDGMISEFQKITSKFS